MASSPYRLNVIAVFDLDTLDSFYFENQTWRALHKAWKGFVIAKNKYEVDRMYYHATVIQKLQKELDHESVHFLI